MRALRATVTEAGWALFRAPEQGTVAKPTDRDHPGLAGSGPFPGSAGRAKMPIVDPASPGRLAMPAKFEKLGISFQYPDNWTLDEQDMLAGRNSVTVYSPGGAFWSVAVHPHSADPARLAKAAVEAMKQEYDELDAEEAREAVAGREMIGYDLNFCYLDLINTARVRCLRTDQSTWTIFCQAEDREFDRIEMVFQAMTTSLLNGLKRLTSQG